MTCATPGCDASASGKSKYCRPHKAVARQRWLERVAQSNAEREAKHEAHAKLWGRALEAGKVAHEAATPTPMTVVDPQAGQRWHVSEGACGFAWVTIYPGNSSFARWAAKHAGFRKSYRSGLEYWVSMGGQSIARKEAAARAIADVLQGGGIKAYAGSRLD